jgi:hypothetical protein
MITIILIAAAVYALAGKAIADKAKAVFASMNVPSIDGKHVAFAALLAAALISWVGRPSAVKPDVQPDNPAAFSLRGVFVGPTASDDAATVSALCNALGDSIEYDGQHDKRLRTGVAFDELRAFAREMKMHGDSIGDRQPRARDAIAKFLDAAVGSSGGPVTDESRAAWVAAFREIGRAAANVAK